MKKIILIDLYGVLFKDLYDKWLDDNEKILENWLDDNKTNDDLFNFETEKGQKIVLSPNFPNYFKELIYTNEQKNISDKTFYLILENAAKNTTEKDMYKLIHAKDGILNLDIIDLIEQEKAKGSIIGLVSNANKEIVEECLNYQYDEPKNKCLGELFSSEEDHIKSAKIFLAENIGHPLPGLNFFQGVCSIMKCNLKDLYFIAHGEKDFTPLTEGGINVNLYDGHSKPILGDTEINFHSDTSDS